MKLFTRRVAVALVLLLAFSLAMPALAQWPDDAVFFPMTDESWYIVEAGASYPDEVESVEVGADGAWLNVVANENGSVVLNRTADCPDACGWPRIKTIPLADVDLLPLVDLAKTPYLYYDFVAEGCEWMLMLIVDDVSVKLAKEISRIEGTGILANTDSDGPAGTYKGRVDLNEYFDTGVVTGLKANAKMDLTGLTFFVVDPNRTGVVTVNAIYLGDENQTEPPTGGGTTAPSDDPTEAPVDDPTEAPADDPTDEPTDEPTVEPTDEPTETPTDTPTDEPTETPTDAPSDDEGGNNTTLWIIIGAAAVLVIGVVVYFLLSKKKK